MAAFETEQRHVHDVYEAIAEHFSNTRYKPWPRVDRYIQDQQPGSIGCDVGGGNGKYLGYSHVYIIACDRSAELTRIASSRVRDEKLFDDAVRCDALDLCYVPRFDFALSIAVVHHLSTRSRRVEMIEKLLGTLNTNGTALLYVWALEQHASRRGFHAGQDPDVFVPWVNNKNPSEVHQRFYHLYAKGELEEDIVAAGGRAIDSGYERDNWWCVAAPLR